MQTEIVQADVGGVRVRLAPVGPFWAVQIDDLEESLTIGRTPYLAQWRAAASLKRKLRDIAPAVKAGRALALYTRLRCTLSALERLEVGEEGGAA